MYQGSLHIMYVSELFKSCLMLIYSPSSPFFDDVIPCSLPKAMMVNNGCLRWVTLLCLFFCKLFLLFLLFLPCITCFLAAEREREREREKERERERERENWVGGERGEERVALASFATFFSSTFLFVTSFSNKNRNFN
jgi:hypothetical protein